MDVTLIAQGRKVCNESIIFVDPVEGSSDTISFHYHYLSSFNYRKLNFTSRVSATLGRGTSFNLRESMKKRFELFFPFLKDF